MENLQGHVTEEMQWRQRMEELAAKQADYAKKQFIMTCVSAAAKILILAAVIVGVGLCVSKVSALAGQAQSVMTELQNALGDLESAAESLKTLTSQPQASGGVDLSKLEEAIDGLTKLFQNWDFGIQLPR